jgi:hypothetical protein
VGVRSDILTVSHPRRLRILNVVTGSKREIISDRLVLTLAD